MSCSDQEKYLVEKVVKSKKFQFGNEELENIEDLISKDLIKGSGNAFRIKSENSEFVRCLIKYYARQFSFDLNSDFTSMIDFYQRIEEEFDDSKVVFGISENMTGILSELIISANKAGEVFDDFIKKIELDSQLYFRFSTAFSYAMPYLKIPVAKLEVLLRSLFKGLFKPDVDWNMSLGDLLTGCRSYSKVNDHKAKLLLNRFNKSPIPEISGNLIAGILAKKPSDALDLLGQYSEDDEGVLSIIVALKVIDFGKDEISGLLSFFNTVSSSNRIFELNQATIYVKFINSRLLNKDERNLCFITIRSFILGDDIELVNSVISALAYLKGFENKKLQLISQLTRNDPKGQFSNSIAYLLQRFEKPKNLFQFFRTYERHHKYVSDIRLFHSSINLLLRKDKLEFDRSLIDILIDDIGGMRLIGKRIYSYLSSHNSYSFDIDLCTLPQLDQIKLIISLLVDKPEPYKVFPTLMELRKTSYPLVLEYLLCQVEFFIEIFSGSMVSVLKETLDEKELADKAIIERAQSAYENFTDYLETKSKINEFNPSVTMAKLQRIFNENYYEKMGEQMKSTIDDESVFLNMVQTVQLAKGGGWKLGDRNEVSKLSRISSSFQFPRLYYIDPERFDLEVRNAFAENWKEEFKEWESIISSLENT